MPLLLCLLEKGADVCGLRNVSGSSALVFSNAYTMCGGISSSSNGGSGSGVVKVVVVVVVVMALAVVVVLVVVVVVVVVVSRTRSGISDSGSSGGRQSSDV